MQTELNRTASNSKVLSRYVVLELDQVNCDRIDYGVDGTDSRFEVVDVAHD